MKYIVRSKYIGCVVYGKKPIELSSNTKQSDLKALYNNGHEQETEAVEPKEPTSSEADKGGETR